MSVVVPNGRDLIHVPVTPVHRISVDEYHRMIQAGVFTENDNVELPVILEGTEVGMVAVKNLFRE